jgi:hypothetical protein
VAYQGAELDAELVKAWRRPESLEVMPPRRVVRGKAKGRDSGDPRDGNDHVDDHDPGEPGFTRVGNLWVPESAVRAPHRVRLGQTAHPRGIGYRIDSLARIRDVLQGRPDWIADSWSAATLWGLDYFCDDADTCVLSGGRKKLAGTQDEVTRYRREKSLASVKWYSSVDPRLPELKVAPPVLTIIQCLRSLRSGEHSWQVHPGTGLDNRTLLAVQLVDAMAHLFGFDPARLLGACGDFYCRNHLRRIIEAADRGAESPMETVMRLMVKEMFGDIFTSQLVISRDGSVSDPVHTGENLGWGIVARVDLGCPELKLALQYDGSGHLERSRRDSDSRVSTELANLGLACAAADIRAPEGSRAVLLDGC